MSIIEPVFDPVQWKVAYGRHLREVLHERYGVAESQSISDVEWIEEATRRGEVLLCKDLAIARNGSYYLTYHKFATREQMSACYPQFKQFLELKRKHDPHERFQSDWYRHYRKLFASS